MPLDVPSEVASCRCAPLLTGNVVPAGDEASLSFSRRALGLNLDEALLVVWDPALLHPVSDSGFGDVADLRELTPAAKESYGLLWNHDRK